VGNVFKLENRRKSYTKEVWKVTLDNENIYFYSFLFDFKNWVSIINLYKVSSQAKHAHILSLSKNSNVYIGCTDAY